MLALKSVDLGDPNSVSPGILGFIAFFLLAVALYLLLRNMNGHLRRMRYRAEEEGQSLDGPAEGHEPGPGSRPGPGPEAGPTGPGPNAGPA